MNSLSPFWKRIDLTSVQVQNWIALALVAFFISFEILSVQKVSITFDEPFHYQYGKNILNLNSNRLVLDNGNVDDSKMPITALNALPAKLSESLPDGGLKNFLGNFNTARFVTVIFSALVAWLVFFWSRSLYGFVPGIASLILFVFDPNIIAYSQLVTTDIYATGTILFACYGIWKFANTRRLCDGILSTFTLGLSEIAKYTSIVLLPLFILALVLHDLPAQLSAYKEKGVKAIVQYLGQLALYVALACMFIFVFINMGLLFNRSFIPLNQYDFQSQTFKLLQNMRIVQDIRVPFPYPYLQGLDRVIFNERTGENFGNIYLLGQLRAGQGFTGYYFVASALKVPIATQIAIIAGVTVYVLSEQRKKLFFRNEIFLLVPVAFYTVYFNFFYNAQIGFRYYIVVFPLLYVFAGGLFANWPKFSAKQKTAGFMLTVYLIVSVLSYYPYYLSYFNELVWDRKYAYKFLADLNLDWGQGAYYLQTYLTEHPSAVYQPS